MRFEFSTATRIIFGEGTSQEAASLAASFGDTALVVTGRRQERIERLLNGLKHHGVDYHLFSITGEPTVEMIQKGTSEARKAECDMVIAMGGGSVVDAGKAIAAHLTNPGDIYDYLEVIGRGHPIEKAPLPYIAIPTTGGTGAEVTRNAVIGSPDQKEKVSLRSSLMYPKLAVIDPELTYSLPPEITASTGMDAITQVLEPYVSKMANPMTDAICKEGMGYAGYSLLRAYRDGEDQEAREKMSLVSLFGGLSLANAKLGAVHGFAGPLGGLYNAPHGAICACLLPLVMATNIKAIKIRHPDHQILKRYDEVATFLTGNENAKAEDGVAWVQKLKEDLNTPPLSVYGVKRDDFSNIIDKAARSSSMKGNPIDLTKDELINILDLAL